MVGLASCCCLCFFAQGVLESPMRMVQSQTFLLFKYSDISVLGSRATPEVWVTEPQRRREAKMGVLGRTYTKDPFALQAWLGLVILVA